MANRIQVRRGTSTQWSNADPVLAEGEIGFNTTLGAIKVGDGVSNWSGLDYLPTMADLTPAEVGAIALTEKGAANGVAELDADKNVITASKIVFEGATADAHELFIQLGAEPTSDVTLTLPTISGTVALTSDISGYAPLSGATFTGAVTGTDLTLSGNLTVNGTTTNINTQNLIVEDKNIVIGDVAVPTDTTADGGGITLKGTTDKTFNWVDATDSWTSSENLNVLSGKTIKINGTDVLTSTQVLGKSVPSGTIVGTTDSQTLTNKTLTSPVISTISNTGTLTLPTSTDTLVGRATTDTLTNKTINGANNTLTVRIANDVSGLGTNVATFLATPSSANLASAITDETGSGALVFGTTPTLSQPVINNPRWGYTTTATAGGTTTLTATSSYIQIFTGSSNQTVVMPVTNTLATGQSWEIENNSTGTLTVNSSGGNLIVSINPGHSYALTCIGTSLTTAADWNAEWNGSSTITGTGANVFATSPTLVTPNIGVATGTSFNSITGLSSTTPSANGTAAVGTSATVARADHVHPISALTISTGLSGTSYNGSSAVTIAIDSTVATLTGTQTLTNKTFNLSSNTLTGTTAQFNTALSDGDFATLAGTETLTNKTLTSPTVNTPALTLSTTTSTTEGRIAWDSTNDKIIIGDGTTAREFASSTLITNAQVGTSYTLVLADKDKLVELNNASAITLNIPTNSVAYPVGTQINILQTGAGQVTIAAGTPATTTVNGTPGLKLRAQWSSATLIKRATETWVAIGDLSA